MKHSPYKCHISKAIHAAALLARLFSRLYIMKVLRRAEAAVLIGINQNM